MTGRIDSSRRLLETNPGFYTLNAAPCGSTATIAATGLGRSGTTMLARVLTELGLFMGERLSPMSHEDGEFRALVKAKDIQGFSALCRKRDSAHDKWGFKAPNLRKDLPIYLKEMRQPRVIIVFRDALAISLRNKIAVQTDILPGIEAALRGYNHLVRALHQISCPVLLVSYEKALLQPAIVVETIAQFCGVDIRSANEVAKTISNGDLRYLTVQ